MKKLLLTMGTIGVAAAPLAAVVSCGKKAEKNGTIQIPDVVLKSNINTNANSQLTALTTGNASHSVDFVQSQHLADVSSNSFNGLMIKGIKEAAADASVTSNVGTNSPVYNGQPIATKDKSSYLTAYGTALQNHDFFVTGGNTHTDVLNGYNFGNNKGAILWGQPSTNSHVVSMITRRNEYTFVTGVLTAMYMNNHFDKFGKDGHLKTGGFVGLAINDLFIFIAGYQQGIKWFNEHVVGNADYAKYNKDNKPFSHKIEWIDLGDKTDYATGGFDPGEVSLAKSNKLVEHGADFIFTAAGGQTADVKKAIDSHVGKKGNVFLVGIDQSLEAVTGYQDYVKFSAIDSVAGLKKLIIDVSSGHTKLGAQVAGGLRSTNAGVIQSTSITMNADFNTGNTTGAKDGLLGDMIRSITNSNAGHTLSGTEAEIYAAAQSDRSRRFDY